MYSGLMGWAFFCRPASLPRWNCSWYAFGRLAWNPDLSSRQIADEWLRMTFTNEAPAVGRLTKLMLESHEAVVDYMTPLGLHHIM
jgi:alpha-glucuronidase